MVSNACASVSEDTGCSVENSTCGVSTINVGGARIDVVVKRKHFLQITVSARGCKNKDATTSSPAETSSTEIALSYGSSEDCEEEVFVRVSKATCSETNRRRLEDVSPSSSIEYEATVEIDFTFVLTDDAGVVDVPVLPAEATASVDLAVMTSLSSEAELDAEVEIPEIDLEQSIPNFSIEYVYTDGASAADVVQAAVAEAALSTTTTAPTTPSTTSTTSTAPRNSNVDNPSANMSPAVYIGAIVASVVVIIVAIVVAIVLVRRSRSTVLKRSGTVKIDHHKVRPTETGLHSRGPRHKVAKRRSKSELEVNDKKERAAVPVLSNRHLFAVRELARARHESKLAGETPAPRTLPPIKKVPHHFPRHMSHDMWPEPQGGIPVAGSSRRKPHRSTALNADESPSEVRLTGQGDFEL